MLLSVFLGLVTAVGAGYFAAIFLVAVVITFAGLIDFRLAVFALMVVFPITATYFFPRKLLGVTGLNPFNVLMLLSLLSFALHRLFSRQGSKYPLPDVKFFWPIFVAIVGSALVGSNYINLIPPYYLLKAEIFTTKFEYFRDVVIKPAIIFGFVYLIAAGVARSKNKVGWVYMVLLGGSALSALVIIFVAVSGVGIGALSGTSARSFLSPTGMHANELGVALLPLFTCALFMMPAVKRFRLWLLLALIVFMAVTAIGLTFSRAALLATLIVSLIFAFKRRRVGWIFAGLAVIVAATLFAPDPVKERVLRGFETGAVGGRNSSADPLTAGRVGGIWKPLLPDIQSSAVFGGGIHSTMWSKAARNGQIYVAHPHNAYIQLVLDHGLVFGAFLVFFLVRTWRLWRRLSLDERVDPVIRAFFEGICVAFLAFLLQCMSGSTLLLELSHAMYLAAIGVALGVSAGLDSETVGAASPAAHSASVSANRQPRAA